MSLLPGAWKTAIIAASGVLSDEVDLGEICETIAIIIPTITSAQISVQVAEASGGTFQDLYITSSSDADDDQPLTTAGTGGITWVVPIGGFQHIKIKSSQTQTGAVSFHVRGIR